MAFKNSFKQNLRMAFLLSSPVHSKTCQKGESAHPKQQQ